MSEANIQPLENQKIENYILICIYIYKKKMSIINDHINLVNINRPIDEVLLKAIKNPIKIKYAVITKEFDKDSVLKYFPTIIFKYIEDIDEMYVKYVKYKNK